MDDWNTHFVKQCNEVRASRGKEALTTEQGTEAIRAFNYKSENRDRVWIVGQREQAWRDLLVDL